MNITYIITFHLLIIFQLLSQVVIAKMDATANEIDVPGVEVSGFPTLYFFPGNDKVIRISF